MTQYSILRHAQPCGRRLRASWIFQRTENGMPDLRSIVESAWDARAELTPASVGAELAGAITQVLDGLESGALRVAEPDGNGGWRINEWLKKAVLLSFRIHQNMVMDAAPAPYFDKVPLRFE